MCINLVLLYTNTVQQAFLIFSLIDSAKIKIFIDKFNYLDE